MTDFTFTFEQSQVDLAKKIDEQAETMYYANHDQDELEAHAFELGIDIDMLKKVNKTTLKKANRARATEILETHKAERNAFDAQRTYDRFFEKALTEVEKYEQAVRDAANEIATSDNMLHSAGYWNVGRVMEARAKLELAMMVRAILYETQDKGETWTLREDASPRDVQKQITRKVMWAASSAANQSTSSLSNEQDRLLLAAMAKYLDSLQFEMSFMERYGLLDDQEEA